MNINYVYSGNEAQSSRWINLWDVLLLVCLALLLFFLGWAGDQMAVPYALGEPINISLSPYYLPMYALRSTFRMFIALMLSIVCSLAVGALAAKYKRAERLIIPAIDLLQAVPVLSFLSISITAFIHLFPGSLLGPECASIFVIFTAQVWNITLSFYQSLKSVPADLIEASRMFQLSRWQRFWRVEVPCSLSGLIWNIMMSMSASWFFVVLSEAIVVAHQDIHLPGIGSYIALAIEQHNIRAVVYAILAMMVVIFIYDQVLFRPLLVWSEKFKMDESTAEAYYQSWLIDFFRKSVLMRYMKAFWVRCRSLMLIGIVKGPMMNKTHRGRSLAFRRFFDFFWGILLCALAWSVYDMGVYMLNKVSVHEIMYVFQLGLATSARVFSMIFLSSMIWIPVGVWLGLRPAIAGKAQAVIQLCAAFPANLFYPLFVLMIVRCQLNLELWLTPLMILGTQWYILFNVIAGASNIPRDLMLAADNFGVSGWQWWRRLGFPAIFPYYITGAMTAAGGAWNASIVAEWVSWGSHTLEATGLGAYIHENTLSGQFPQLALGTMVMCCYVLFWNQLIWRPLYRLAQDRFVD